MLLALDDRVRNSQLGWVGNVSVPIGQIPSHFNPPSPAPNLREKPMVTSKGEAKRGTDRGDTHPHP